MHLQRISPSLSLCTALALTFLVGVQTASAITPLPPAALNTNAAIDAGEDSNVSVATDGALNWVAVWQSGDDLDGTIDPDLDILVARSTDDGANWTDAAPLNTHFETDTGDDRNCIVVSTFGAGNWLAVWQSSDPLGSTIGTDWDVLASRSTDDGVNWSTPVAINFDAVSDGGDSDGNSLEMATDGAGTVVVTWSSDKNLGGTLGTDTDILFIRSTDNGVFWSNTQALNTNADSDSGEDSGHAPVVTDGGGYWVAVWGSTDDLGGSLDPDWDILVSRSGDNGATWTAPAALHGHFETDSASEEFSGSLATDGSGNWVVAWESADDLGGTIGDDMDILVSRSTNNGVTWTAPAALHPNAYSDSGADQSPWLATDAAGTWLATWQSNDDLGATVGADWDILMASSTDDGATWANLQAVNPDAGVDSGWLDSRPRVVTDGAGNWVTAWNSTDHLGDTIGYEGDILVSRSSDDGANWTAAAPLNSNAASSSGNDWGVHVAADGAGSWVAVWHSNDDLGGTIGTDLDILVSRSSDNGATWTAPEALHSHFEGDEGTDRLWGPLITDGAGNWWVAWQSTDDLDDLGPSIGTDSDALVSHSTDNGATWSAPEPVNNDANSDTADDGWGLVITTDGAGTILATWCSGKNLGGTIGADWDIIYARSTDSGVSWSGLAALNTNAASDTGLDYARAPVATDGAGNWVIVWSSTEDLESTGDTDFDHLVARSSDHGATWTAPEYLHDYFKTDVPDEEFRGWLATDGAGLWVATWMSYDNMGLPIGTDHEILMSRSSDNGATWTRPEPLNANAATDDGQVDWAPFVVADGNANWVTFWHSSDYSGGPLGTDSDILVARSTDDGISWTDPTPLNTNAYSDSRGDAWVHSATDAAGNWVSTWISGEDLDGTIGTDWDILYTTFALRTVDSTADDGDFSTADGVCDIDDSAGDGPCTLRAAIQQANADPNLDNIGFHIASAGPHTIQPGSALPILTQPVMIDGYTQDGASANTNPPDAGSNAVLQIELDGSSAGVGTHGLTLTAGGSTIQGLAINRFGDDGIRVTTNGGNTIEGCFIGTDTTGTVDLGNSGDGVDIRDAPDNTVGGTTPAARNVVSGNDYNGVSIYGGGATSNLVQGNLIGTNAAGTAALGNSHNGVSINEASGNTIGGTTAAARNVASGSGNNGVALSGSGATGNLVQGNYLGTDVSGTADLGNSSHGAILEGAPDNTIGGTVPGAGNLASGNDTNGVRIQGSGATGNLVQGNYIGTDATGTADLGNSLAGVLIAGAPGNTVGGTTSAARNVVSGNGNNGVTINLSGATGNLVQGNYIGTDVSGTADLGNDAQGVGIHSPGNTVGGAIAGAGNVISGNAGSGVSIEEVDTTGNLLQGNHIGTNAAGDLGIPNDRSGVRIGSGASDNTVGETGPGESNTIAFNTESGVCVYEPTSTDNSIRGNSIHSNTLLGIDLAPTWLDCSSGLVTANDAGDSDTGPNDLMNFPVIVYAYYDGADTTVSGTLDTVDPGSATVDVYATDAADGSGHGEGRAYLGSAAATGGSWELVLSGLPPYTYLFATATDGAGNTSEFSSGPLPDTDGDGIPDDYENDSGFYVSPTETGTDPFDPDSDGDGVCDGAAVVSGTCETAGPDNCPFVGNAGQTNSDGFLAGDACQCGDLDEDGAIDPDDVTIARQHLVGATIGVTYDLERCNVIGPSDGGASDCDVADIFVLERAVAGRPATVENTCQASRAP